MLSLLAQAVLVGQLGTQARWQDIRRTEEAPEVYILTAVQAVLAAEQVPAIIKLPGQQAEQMALMAGTAQQVPAGRGRELQRKNLENRRVRYMPVGAAVI
jgi:hypothetical protein